jgi:hypothetical protein
MQDTRRQLNLKFLDEEAYCDEPPVEFEELDRVLKLMRKDTTPGPDSVQYADNRALEECKQIHVATLPDS